MAFTLTDTILRRMCGINSFPVPTDRRIFLETSRVCLPTNPDDQEIRTEHLVEVASRDYIHPRCTVCQWRPATGPSALFPVVPSLTRCT
jgi:hypothetical protein